MSPPLTKVVTTPLDFDLRDRVVALVGHVEVAGGVKGQALGGIEPGN